MKKFLQGQGIGTNVGADLVFALIRAITRIAPTDPGNYFFKKELSK